MSDRAIGLLARAVTTAAVVGLLLAIVVVIDTGQFFSSALAAISLPAGLYARHVSVSIKNRAFGSSETELARIGTLTTS